MADENDSHYLKSVTSLGDTLQVVTNQDIYSKTGIKLAGKGSRIDSSFYDRLVKHKLLPALDQCMTVESAVTVHELLDRAKAIIAAETSLSKISELVEIERIWSVFSKMKLNDALSFKLTVARETRPALIDHSLRITLLSLYLGLRCDLPERDLIALATAAVVHDLGELHIDPEILRKSHDITTEERRHIYIHPMTTYMILKEFPEYHPLVSTAVLQHHECLDGSGYPSGLTGQSITPLAQILATAEVTGGILEQNSPEIVLKLNKHKLNTNLVGFVSELFRSKQGKAGLDPSIASIAENLSRLARAFEEWDEIFGKQKAPIFRFANQRLGELRQSLFDAGFNPAELSWLTSGIENDTQGMQDVQTLIGEACWQIRSLSRELNRLWPDFEKGDDEDRQIVKDWITHCIKCMEN